MLKEERNSKIIELAKEGKDLKAIGKEFSISRERVRQILEDQHISSSQLKQERVKTAVEAKISTDGIEKLTGDKVVNRYLKKVEGVTATQKAKDIQKEKCLLLFNEGKKPTDIAKELGVHRSTVYGLLASVNIELSVKDRSTRNEEIRKLHLSGALQTDIAKQFSLTTTQVANIIKDRKKPYDPQRYKNYKVRLNQLNNTRNGTN